MITPSMIEARMTRVRPLIAGHREGMGRGFRRDEKGLCRAFRRAVGEYPTDCRPLGDGALL